MATLATHMRQPGAGRCPFMAAETPVLGLAAIRYGARRATAARIHSAWTSKNFW